MGERGGFAAEHHLAVYGDGAFEVGIVQLCVLRETIIERCIGQRRGFVLPRMAEDMGALRELPRPARLLESTAARAQRKPLSKYGEQVLRDSIEPGLKDSVAERPNQSNL